MKRCGTMQTHEALEAINRLRRAAMAAWIRYDTSRTGEEEPEMRDLAEATLRFNLLLGPMP